MIAAAAALALIVVSVLCVYAYFRRSLPLVQGSVAAAGISAPVEIVRDRDAIPHIFASTKHDALFGLGYVHAQDRLWQMEIQRRIGRGRLSEILGPATLPQDRFLRTVGFGRAAEQAWARLPGDARSDIDAYVAGVNAFIGTHHGAQLPPEFTLLRCSPEPWRGEDVLVWGKMMAWDLSANYAYELLRHDLAARVGEARTVQLLPPYPATGLSILTDADLARLPLDNARARLPDTERSRASAVSGASETSATTKASAAGQSSAAGAASETWAAFVSGLSDGDSDVAELLAGSARAEGLGSNNWVVDGSLTASGKPLLANDPHLGARLPSVWYLAHMSAGDFNVIGATLPGTPAVTLGRNRHIAWGATNVAADVEDLYRERIDSSGRFAEYRRRWEPLQIIPETINVKGQAPVRIEVRVSRHGPLVSDAINANNAASRRLPKPPPLEPLALRWTALDPDDTTTLALRGLNDAQNWDEFTAALRWFVVPSQNFVYADTDGHIGYYAPGRIPIRTQGDGSRPAPGWTGEAEWTGWIPFEQLPHVYDPPEHFIVTANHRPVPAVYPYHLGLEWPEPYRGERITELLREKAGLTADDFAAIQADTVSLHAKALLPGLLRHARAQSAMDEQALSLLRHWNGDARGDSAAAAVYEAWFLQLAPTMLGGELGPVLTEAYRGRFTFVTRFILNALAAEDGRKACEAAVSTALHEAVAQLARRLGGDPASWRWSDVHRAVFPHQGLDSVSLFRPLFSRSMPGAGDWSTVDVGPVAADHPFEQRQVPSYRQVIDLSDRDESTQGAPAPRSRFIDAVGQSGHPLSPHYADFLADWRAVRHRPMRMDRADAERGAEGILRLIPSAN